MRGSLFALGAALALVVAVLPGLAAAQSAGNAGPAGSRERSVATELPVRGASRRVE